MIGRVLRQRYQLLEVIGQGGMAIVYRAKDYSTGRDVAVKVLREEFTHDDEFIRRFHREGLAAVQMSHRNIVALIDVGEEDGLRFLVMEYIKGTTLKELIREKGRLGVSRAIDIAVQICHALEHAHAKQIIHRDIKPQNILVDEFGDVKVADFGIARAANAQTMTIADGGVLGSVHYVSPEQARGGVAEAQSDMYSLGVVIYEMVTGEVPFDGDSPVAIALQHIQQPVRRPRRLNPNIPIALEEVILKAMAKQATMRYQSAGELEQDLERVLSMPQGGFVVGLDPVTGAGRPMPGGQQRPGGYTNYPQPSQARPAAQADDSTRRAVRIALLGVVTIGLVIALYLIVSSMLRGITPPDSSMTEVPRLVNLSLEKATKALDDAALKVSGQKQEEYSDEVKKGNVIRSEPEEGTRVPEQSSVVLVFSSGVEEIAVPKTYERDLEDAKEILTEAGFVVGKIRTTRETELPNNAVVRTEPAAGEMAPKNSEVTLYISDLPSSFALKDVRGLDEMSARAALENIEMKLKVTYAGEKESTEFAPGRICETSPGPTSMVSPGDEILIYIAKMPEFTAGPIDPLPEVTLPPIATLPPATDNQPLHSIPYNVTFDVATPNSVVVITQTNPDTNETQELYRQIYEGPGLNSQTVTLTRKGAGYILVTVQINNEIHGQPEMVLLGG